MERTHPTNKMIPDSESGGAGTVPPPATEVNRRLIGDRGDHFLRRMEGETGVPIAACYQCERCTNACPVAQYMDIKPHQVIRHVQLGWREALMNSTTIWVCLSLGGMVEWVAILRKWLITSATPTSFGQ